MTMTNRQAALMAAASTWNAETDDADVIQDLAERWTTWLDGPPLRHPKPDGYGLVDMRWRIVAATACPPGWSIWTIVDGKPSEPTAVAAWLTQEGRYVRHAPGGHFPTTDEVETRVVPGIVLDGDVMGPEDWGSQEWKITAPGEDINALLAAELSGVIAWNEAQTKAGPTVTEADTP